MKNQLTMNRIPVWQRSRQWLLGLSLAVGFVAAHRVDAQITNAFDSASDLIYDGLGAPDGLSPGGQNGGSGFGPWTFTVNGSGGAFIANSGAGSSGRAFNLWNNAENGETTAVRDLAAPLSPGDSFGIVLRLTSLRPQDVNRFELQDANGNVVFSYWHRGGDDLDGWYSDANTAEGVAVNFPYAYQSFQSFKFVLNSATTYTFYDLSSGSSITGTISGEPITRFALIRRNGSPAPGSGQDFQFDLISITSASPPTFSGLSPAANALSVATNASISLNIAAGSVALNQSSVSLKLDGNVVTPMVTGSEYLTSVSYTPPTPFSFGSVHTAEVVVQDINAASYTNTWSFSVGYASLPVTLAGPFTTGSGVDLPIFTREGEGWIGTNYDTKSSRTLYTRFSMVFHDLNNENGNGGGYGGLQFFQDNQEKLIIGNAWMSLLWSMDAAGSQQDLDQYLPVTLEEWHTIVVRTDYTPDGNDTVRIWLDPDFSTTEANQPSYPTTFTSFDAAFNNIRLRCGNGSASATWTNIIVAETSAGVGFVAPSDPQFQGYIPGQNANNVLPDTPIAVTVLFGTYGISTNTVTMDVDGTPVTPEFSVTPNSITLTHQPAVPFEPNSFHTVTVSLVDSNATPYSTSWWFMVDPYPSLPVTNAGPIDVGGGGVGVEIWNQQNHWIGNNYGNDSTNTLYARFSINFWDLNFETGNGGGYGGLHFMNGNDERLIVGNAWTSLNWSLDAGGNQQDLPPATPVELGTWHTIVIKVVFVPNADDQISVWMDPDFSKSENGQPVPPFQLTGNVTFNHVNLRCGNGTAYASFENIIIAANAQDVGFAAPTEQSVLSIERVGNDVNLSWTGAGILEEAPTATGPWSDSANQSNPQTRSATGDARFFRVRQ